ncbi:hypothetical protein NC651_024192 [Populus alba x Populus x berolinensis]|nr:hypothetical protein NC651_024192 [Populus alba x Populus x berolinensis]
MKATLRRGSDQGESESKRLRSQFRSQNGHFRVLERLSKKSELLRGLENYRFEIVEANPNTFVIPHHCDSDAVLFVLRGKGTMTFVSQWKRESYSLERGHHVMKVQAGVVGYLINPDDKEKFSAAMLVNPVNTPGKFRVIRDYEFDLVILSDFMTKALIAARAQEISWTGFLVSKSRA